MQIMPFEDAEDLPVQPVRPDQGVAARRLPADRGRPDDAGPQPDRLPHRDRAGRVRAQQPGAGHRPEPGPDAAGPAVLLRRRAPGTGSASTTSRSRSTRPTAPVHTYSKDGAMRDPQRRPTRCTRRTPRAARRPTPSATGAPSWYADGELIRTAYDPHAEDDDWGQAGTLVREVMDDAARDRLVGNIVGHLLERRHRAGARARVRVLAQHRQGHRRADRGGRPGQVRREGPEGRRTGQSRTARHAAKA